MICGASAVRIIVLYKTWSQAVKSNVITAIVCTGIYSVEAFCVKLYKLRGSR